MLVFGLCSTSDDQPGWSMDSNPIRHPSPAKTMKCSFLDYVQLLMISRAGRWTRTPSATPLQPKKMKCLFLDYVQLLMISLAGRWTQTHLPPLSRQNNEMLIFRLCSTSDDRPSWLMDSNPICHPSPAKKNEMLVFGLRSISDDQPGWSMDSNPSATPLKAKQ